MCNEWVLDVQTERARSPGQYILTDLGRDIHNSVGGWGGDQDRRGTIKAEDIISSQENEGKGLQEDSVCNHLDQKKFANLGNNARLE